MGIPATGDSGNKHHRRGHYITVLGIRKWVPYKRTRNLGILGDRPVRNKNRRNLGILGDQPKAHPKRFRNLGILGAQPKQKIPKKGTYAYYLAKKNGTLPKTGPSRPYTQMAKGNPNNGKLPKLTGLHPNPGKLNLGHRNYRGPSRGFGGSGGVSQADYLAQLAAKLNQGKVDYESALRKSAQEIKKGYHIDIRSLRQTIGQARHTEQKNSNMTGQMYNALTKSYYADARRQNKVGGRDARSMNNLAAQAAAGITKNTKQVLSGEHQLAAGLGLPTSPSDQTRSNAAQAIASVGKQGLNAATTAKKLSINQRNFLRSGGHGAALEGTDAKAQLLLNLQNYVNQTHGKIAGLKADKQRELAANRSKILDAVSSMNAQQAQDTWQRAMDLAQFNLTAQNDQASNRLDLAKFKEQLAQDNLSAQQDAAQNKLDAAQNNPLYASMQMLAGAPHPRQDAGFIKNLFDTNVFQQQKFKTGKKSTATLTPEAAAAIAEQKARAAGITNPRDIARIRLAAMKSPSLG